MRKHFLELRLPGELLWLWQQIRPFLGASLLSFVCTGLGVLLSLSNPLILKWLIDRSLPAHNYSLVGGLAALLFLSFELRTLLSSIGSYITMSSARGMAIRLRMRLLRHLDVLSASYYETTPLGSAIYPLKEPVDEIAYFGSDVLPALMRIVFTTVLTLAAMLMLSVKLAITVFPLLPVFVIGRRYFRNRLKTDADAVQRSRLAWSDFLQEHIPATIQLQFLRGIRKQERTAFRTLAANVRSEQKLFRTGSYFTLFNSFFLVSSMSWVLGYGGWLVLSGVLTVGSLIAFYGLVGQLFEPLSSAAEIYARLQKTFASMRQVRLILASTPAIANCDSPVEFDSASAWNVQLDSVRFGYAERQETLSVEALYIEAGSQIAVTGENGAGKSTLGKLLARIYDVNAGSILVGGQDIRHIQLESVRRCISYVPREPSLFGGSISDNLRFGKASAAQRELEQVLEVVNLTPVGFTECTEHGVGPAGCRLSGGERQRLALARALLMRPKILILDEATSCLDPFSEEEILINIRAYLPAATTIVVSHRLSTIAQFDRVLLLLGGRIAFDGSSAEFVVFHRDYGKFRHSLRNFGPTEPR
jgi:ABC-type multidrug transport system fused ATPase/permease subunit